MNCELVSQQGRSLWSSFVLSFSSIIPAKFLIYLKTCLWIPEIYKHRCGRLSSAQFGLVMFAVKKNQVYMFSSNNLKKEHINEPILQKHPLTDCIQIYETILHDVHLLYCTWSTFCSTFTAIALRIFILIFPNFPFLSKPLQNGTKLSLSWRPTTTTTNFFHSLRISWTI